jgi:hypothetical protein
MPLIRAAHRPVRQTVSSEYIERTFEIMVDHGIRFLGPVLDYKSDCCYGLGSFGAAFVVE